MDPRPLREEADRGEEMRNIIGEIRKEILALVDFWERNPYSGGSLPTTEEFIVETVANNFIEGYFLSEPTTREPLVRDPKTLKRAVEKLLREMLV